MNFAKVVLVFSTLLAAVSCQEERSGGEDKVLGPAGTNVTQRPATTPSPNAVVLNGCCSFDPGSYAVEELYGDHQAWRVKGENFELIFDYGASLAPVPQLPESAVTLVDGIEVRSRALEPNTGEIPVLTARLEASKLNGMEVVDPRLTVFGQCKTKQACADAAEVAQSLRF